MIYAEHVWTMSWMTPVPIFDPWLVSCEAASHESWFLALPGCTSTRNLLQKKKLHKCSIMQLPQLSLWSHLQSQIIWTLLHFEVFPKPMFPLVSIPNFNSNIYQRGSCWCWCKRVIFVHNGLGRKTTRRHEKIHGDLRSCQSLVQLLCNVWKVVVFSDKIFRSIFGMWMIRNWKSKKLSI